ncbi:hypothetical protein [Streptodolium elevatio]|uniref:Gram-positive cocci surface proteins LPxTG domain-containing protein n=1 Tax=Streptodolium elevatio TaxID=3157996 RepID=A0ABV3DF75_9ACTN
MSAPTSARRRTHRATAKPTPAAGRAGTRTTTTTTRSRTRAATRISAAAIVPAAALAALLAGAAPAQATTTPAPTTPPPAAAADAGPTGRADGQEQAERVEAALREVVDLQLLQPTCGERGALTVAALQALRTIGVEVKSTGLPKIDLGPLGWIGIGSQYPGRAVALELHLLPAGPVPVNLTVGEKACPSRPGTPGPRTPEPPSTATATPVAPTSAPPATRPAASVPSTSPQPSAQPELARTGGGSPTWPFLVSGAGLLAAGGTTAVVAARRRRAG